jgi:hypothetical protein
VLETHTEGGISEEEVEDEVRVPDIEDDLPPLSSLTKKEPSPLMYNNLVEILYAYAFTQRLYNGECHLDISAVYVLLQASSVLYENRVYESCEAACLQAMVNARKVCQSSFFS